MNRVRLLARHIGRVLVRRALLGGHFRSSKKSFAHSGPDSAIVLMSLWNRPTRIEDVLQLLDSQSHAPGVRLYLWNNCRKDHRHYVRQIQGYNATGSLKEVSIVRSPYNLGSISRFYWARKLARVEDSPPVIVLDDDQNMDSNFVAAAVAQYRPGRALGWWAWTIHGSYWNRSPANVGDRVDHIGPGGMVCDSRLFLDETFFTEIPDRFGLLDDIWFCYYATRHGYSLGKLDVTIDFVMHETNQFHRQSDVKPEFYDFLHPSKPAG